MKLIIAGHWQVLCKNPNGRLAWAESVPNGATYVGLAHAQDVLFSGGSANATWYGGLISNAGFSAVAAADAMAAHTGWTEFTGYSQTVRQTWSHGVSSNGITLTTSPFSFTINADGALYGAFLVSDSTKSGTSGILWATGAFSIPRTVIAGQIVTANYSCTFAGG